MITGRKNWLTFGGAPVSGQENGKNDPEFVFRIIFPFSSPLRNRELYEFY